MPIDTKHPQFEARLPDWEKTSDCYEGERRIKEKGELYLPPTAGMLYDGMGVGQPGLAAYQAYVARAVYPGFFADAVESNVGVMHRKGPTIKVPKKLEPMLERLTSEGENAEMLMRRLNELQLKSGRLGLLLEMPTGKGPDAMPFIAVYTAGRVINWDVGTLEQGKQKIEFVVLDESANERNEDLVWQIKSRWRMLALTDTLRTVEDVNQEPVPQGTYIAGEFDETSKNVSEGVFTVPSIAGKTLDFIPFVFLNVKDIAAEPDKPPLLTLANLDLAIYRGEADYRQALFAQAQETLVVIGAGEDDEYVEGKGTRVGAGALLKVPVGGDAKYVGASGAGLSEMRQALENDRDMAKQQGSRMLTTKGGDQQSGDALHTRVSAATVTLPNVARASALALETILKYAAISKGLNPDEVSVIPNIDFAADVMTGQTMLQMMQAKQLGFPLSAQTIHDNMRKQNLTQRTYEEEMDLIEDEAPVPAAPGTRGVGGLPNSGTGKTPTPEQTPKKK